MVNGLVIFSECAHIERIMHPVTGESRPISITLKMQKLALH